MKEIQEVSSACFWRLCVSILMVAGRKRLLRVAGRKQQAGAGVMSCIKHSLLFCNPRERRWQV